MQKKFILITLLTLCTLLKINAQKEENLIGKWQFKEVISENEDQDEKKATMLQNIFGDTKLEFKNDNTYEAYTMGNKEKGTWAMEGLVVYQVSEDGKKSEMNITSLTNEELLFNLGTRNNDLMKLIKVDQFKSLPQKNQVKRVNVEASPDQIEGTWYFKEKEMSEDSEAAMGDLLLTAALENAYFKYNSDGSYEDDAMFKQVVVGTWELQNNNTVLIVTKKEKPVTYDIVKISDEEMGLVNRKMEGVITFVRTKPVKNE